MRAMKDSGFAWIGNIPSDWTVESVKYRVDIKNGSDPTTEGDIPVFGSGGSSFKTCGQSKQCPAVLLGRKGTISDPLLVTSPFWNVDTAFDAHCIPSREDVRYFYYLATCFDYEIYQTQTTVPSMTQRDYLNMRIPCPSLIEQQRIADYLDERCAAIDTQKAVLEKEVDALQRLRKSTIHKAVTKGLTENVPMVNSGVNWIGSYPASWTIESCKYRVSISNGSDPKKDGIIPVYGSGGSSFRRCGEFKQPPAVLLGRKGSISNPVFVSTLYWNVDTAFDVHAKHGLEDIRYFYYLAICFDYESYQTKTALPSMTQFDYLNMRIPCPSLDEQRRIAAYLDERCAAIDSVIDTRTKQISRLEDYRKALIFQYVTGKKEVPV